MDYGNKKSGKGQKQDEEIGLPPPAQKVKSDKISTLWSGYGSIVRQTYLLDPKDKTRTTVILKHVSASHLAGSNFDVSHERKLISYEVERFFYKNLASKVQGAPVAKLFESGPDSILMEDLAVNYPKENYSYSLDSAKVVLKWLANFHATFWQDTKQAVVPPPSKDVSKAQGVWQQGSYWYLDTRQDEFEQLNDDWKALAVKVDEKLKSDGYTFQTLLHGDAKAANIVFNSEGTECAMYDFQYIGRGYGVKDLVYFLSTGVKNMAQNEKELLGYYHQELVSGLSRKENGVQLAEQYTKDIMMEHYELALVDWLRFMKGWGMWGDSRYVERRVDEIRKKYNW